MKKLLTLTAASLVLAAAVLPAQAEHIFEDALGEVEFGVPKAAAAWAADGKKTAGEYYDIEYKPEWISTMCSGDTNEQTAAIDVDLAMSWDETYLYTWLSYTDPDGHNFTTAGQPDFWNGDIVQFSGADGDAAGDGMRLEVGFGKYSDTGELACVNWQDYLGSGFATSGNFPVDDCNIFVDGDVITYEFRIPFEHFVTADTIAEGTQCRVSYCFCWTGEAGAYAVWQLASGISGGKDAGNHALVTLEAAPAAPAAEAAPAAAREESEPTLDVAKVTAPLTVDGVIDEGYTKLHNFYQVDGFKLDNDPDKSIEGSAYAAWDDDNFYLLLEVVTPKQEGNYNYDVANIGKGPCGYAAILGKADGTHTDDQRFEIGHGISAEGDQVWKISGPSDIADNSSQQLWYEDAPWKYYTKRDEATKTNFYEFAIPWDFIDRTGLISYEEGSQIVLTYAANIHTLDEYNAGQNHILEFGGGIWAGAYTDGGTVTLVAAPAPVVEEPAPAPVVEEPAPVEEVPAEEPAAEEVVEAPAEEVVEAPVEEPAAEEVVEEAPQTFDLGVIAAISAIVSLAGFTFTKKR